MDTTGVREVTVQLRGILRDAEREIARAFAEVEQRLATTQRDAERRLLELLGGLASQELKDSLPLDELRASTPAKSVARHSFDRADAHVELEWHKLGG